MSDRRYSIVLGISFGHGDSSACILVDGVCLAAVEEERFVRVKHYGLFPSKAIAYCIKHAGLEPGDVKVVAIARKPRAGLVRKALTALAHPGLLKTKRGAARSEHVEQPVDKLLKIAGLGRARIEYVEHHYAHLATARFLHGPDFQQPESMALMSLDGLGDFVSCAAGKATGSEIKMLHRVHFPHSLGYFYTAMTQYLGFPHFGDEYKVMGLSSYGQPRFLPAMRDLIRETDGFGYRLNLEAFPILKNPVQFSLEKGRPKIRPFFSTPFLTQVLGVPPRKVTDDLTDAHHDLAKSVQIRFEEIANGLLHKLYREVGGETVGLSGGCAHNSVWVGKIPSETPFRNVMTAPACHDAGIAVGAAMIVAGGKIDVQGKHWALLGPAESGQPEISSDKLPEKLVEQKFLNQESLVAWMVSVLSDDKIVGLFNGRMEFGPRALGSRSIVADPRKPEMRQRLNERVKHRELFRPFAASVLWEHQAKWFKNAFYSPHMEAVFEVEPSMRAHIQAVVHVDNTCRIQSVQRQTQPFYWALLDAFRRKTGVPMLINTSFNDNEPIVCTEADAMRCFLNSDLDYLVIGNRAFSKAAVARKAA